MLDFSNMGRLLELAQDIDTEGLIDLASKVDLPELFSLIGRLSDEQLSFLESQVRRIAEEGEATGAAAAPRYYRPFRRAAVIGAGTMGSQIAAHLANAGLDVLLLDIPATDGDTNAIVARGFKQATRMKPPPFFDADAQARVRLGNLQDDIDQLSEAEWVIEAVVEKLDVKRDLMARLEGVVSSDAIVSTNTSGIPIRNIVEDRSPEFRARVLGTHFFNPPRYLRLLEIIPTSDTDQDVIDRVSRFARLNLGKGVVVAKDVPYFIGNRIGLYGQLQAMRQATDGDFSIEEVDFLTGPFTGRPKSATFRTADVVGLDVLMHVSDNLYESVQDDERREVFRAPDALRRLVEHEALGAKSGRGFYTKEGSTIKSVNLSSLDYEEPGEAAFPELHAQAKLSLEERLNFLFEDDSRAGSFFRGTTLDLLAYSARRIPEIADSPADIDRAIRWGFGWELGPFQIWDALGFQRVFDTMEDLGEDLPDWIYRMHDEGIDAFYDGDRVFNTDDVDYRVEPKQQDRLTIGSFAARKSGTLWQNDEARLVDVGDGVALFEFQCRGNALGRRVMSGLIDALDLVESSPSLRGMVIGNEGKNFAVGANLHEVMAAVYAGRFDDIETYLDHFQTTIQRIRYANKPVVVAVHQRVLGGACELLMASPYAVASAESYIGLVELGVGVIPAGTGSTRFAALAAERAPNGHPNEVLSALQPYFETIAMAKVSTSAAEARKLGFIGDAGHIVMNDERRLYAARQIVIALDETGYHPVPRQKPFTVLGKPGQAALEVQLQQYLEGGFISEYDRYLGSQLAHVMTGGALSGHQDVTEEYMLSLEREVFLRLVGERRTQERIRHMLETGKPLRN